MGRRSHAHRNPRPDTHQGKPSLPDAEERAAELPAAKDLRPSVDAEGDRPSATGGYENSSCARLPVARGRVFVRGVLWATATAVVGLLLRTALRSLDLSPAGFSNRIVEYSKIALVVPLSLVALYLGLKASGWLLLALWPGWVGVTARDDELTLSLGPWGRRRLGVKRLEVWYWFEVPVAGRPALFEAHLPPEQQEREQLPQMRHPGLAGSVHEAILRYTGRREPEAAAALHPVVRRWRQGRGPITGAHDARECD
jgi:hypothetical protein